MKTLLIYIAMLCLSVSCKLSKSSVTSDLLTIDAKFRSSNDSISLDLVLPKLELGSVGLGGEIDSFSYQIHNKMYDTLYISKPEYGYVNDTVHYEYINLYLLAYDSNYNSIVLNDFNYHNYWLPIFASDIETDPNILFIPKDSYFENSCSLLHIVPELSDEKRSICYVQLALEYDDKMYYSKPQVVTVIHKRSKLRKRSKS